MPTLEELREQLKVGLATRSSAELEEPLDDGDYGEVYNPGYHPITVKASIAQLKSSSRAEDVLRSWAEQIHREAGWPEGSVLVLAEDNGTTTAMIGLEDGRRYVVAIEPAILSTDVRIEIPVFSERLFDDSGKIPFPDRKITELKIDCRGFGSDDLEIIEGAIKDGDGVQLTIEGGKLKQADVQDPDGKLIRFEAKGRSHSKLAWTWINQADRDAMPVTQADVGRVGLNKTDGTYWQCIGTGSPTGTGRERWKGPVENPDNGCDSCWNQTVDEPAGCMRCGRTIPQRGFTTSRGLPPIGGHSSSWIIIDDLIDEDELKAKTPEEIEKIKEWWHRTKKGGYVREEVALPNSGHIGPVKVHKGDLLSFDTAGVMWVNGKPYDPHARSGESMKVALDDGAKVTDAIEVEVEKIDCADCRGVELVRGQCGTCGRMARSLWNGW